MEKRELEGTARASTRRRAEGGIVVDVKTITECPGLSVKAKKHWPFFRTMFAKLPVVAESDIATVQQLVECYSELQEYRAILLKEGRFYTSQTKEGEIVRAHPAVSAYSDADKRFRQYLNEFGMTPASRSKIKADQDGEKKDPLSEFM